MNSTHKVEVVPVALRKHENADSLSIVDIDGYTCVARTQDWVGVEKAAWIPPDNLVDTTRPEFAFLADGKQFVRIKAKKLRGVLSFGLLVPIDDKFAVGDDVTEVLGVVHYTPQTSKHTKTNPCMESEIAPSVYAPKYDLEAFRKYGRKVFTDGEPVIITEKIHGANARYVYSDGRMYCGSRTNWKREFPLSFLTLEGVEEERARAIFEEKKNQPVRKNDWWQALDNTPALRKYCEANPGTVVYGEMYGKVGGFPYDTNGTPQFVAFDLMKAGKWIGAKEAYEELRQAGIPVAPLFNPISANGEITPIPYNFDEICKITEGRSLIGKHIREGVVVRPLEERTSQYGRVVLKSISAAYLEKKEGDDDCE